MSNIAISVENLSKNYILGAIGTGTFYGDLKSWWAKQRGRPDPNLRIGQSEKSHLEGTIGALQDVSFTVKQGEALGIIGRNGAGKSTLLKILSQVTAPSSGLVNIKGRMASLLEVGTGFHAELTGRENVYLNGTIMGMSRTEIHRKFDEIVDFSGVEKFIDTPVKRYSSGMYVRLAFAVAAYLEPDILIVDEVLAVGDAEFQKKCLGKMENVAGHGRTVLFVSHTMSAIQRLCARTILLSQGMLVADGPTSKVVEQYLSLGRSQEGERIWQDEDKAPGDHVVRLRAVRAYNSKHEISSEFSLRDSWYLEVEFDVLVPGHNLNVNLYIYSMTGSLLFIIGDFQTSEWQNRPRSVGMHRSRCRIPGDLLNDGTLRILVGLVSPPVELRAIEEDALTVSIVDDFSTSGARGYYPANWPGGAVRPLVTWEYDFEPKLEV